MPEFNVGQTYETEQPVIEVTVERDRPLPPGLYKFQLVVVDSEGGESEPTSVVVRVNPPPVAKLTAQPNPVRFGQPIRLSAEGSTPPERIRTYRWTRLE